MVRKPIQLPLFREKKYRSGTKADLIHRGLGYGGQLHYRKLKRPFQRSGCSHFILRSRLLSAQRSLLKANRKAWVRDLIKRKAKKYQAKLYTYSVNSNHLHLLMKFPSREMQAQFLRDLSGSLALKIKKVFKIEKNTRVWDARPFSRLVKSGSYQALIRYIEKNRMEAAGIWEYTQRPVSQLIKALAKIEALKRPTEAPG